MANAKLVVYLALASRASALGGPKPTKTPKCGGITRGGTCHCTTARNGIDDLTIVEGTPVCAKCEQDYQLGTKVVCDSRQAGPKEKTRRQCAADWTPCTASFIYPILPPCKCQTYYNTYPNGGPTFYSPEGDIRRCMKDDPEDKQLRACYPMLENYRWVTGDGDS